MPRPTQQTPSQWTLRCGSFSPDDTSGSKAEEADPYPKGAAEKEEWVEDPFEAYATHVPTSVTQEIGRSLEHLQHCVITEVKRLQLLLHAYPHVRQSVHAASVQPVPSADVTEGRGSQYSPSEVSPKHTTNQRWLQNHLHLPGFMPGAPRSSSLFSTSSTMELKNAHEVSARKEAARKREEECLTPVKSTRATRSSLSLLAKSRVQTVVSSSTFEFFWIGVVIANSLVIAVQTQYRASHLHDDELLSFRLIQHAFSVAFAVELLLRAYSEGCCRLFTAREWAWSILDLFIVLASISEMVLDFAFPSLKNEGVQGASSFRTIRIIRVARFLRALRVQRAIRLVSSLRTLIYSIAATLKSLIWALVLLVVIMYIAGVTVNQAVLDYLEDASTARPGDTTLKEFWGTLGISMVTLFQSISGGANWRDAVKPLRAVSPVFTWVVAAYVAFTLFAVLNVVTGVFCNSAIESAAQNPDILSQDLIHSQKLYVKNIQRLFAGLAQERHTQITFHEFEQIVQNPENKAFLAALEIETLDAWTLFRLIDSDKDGIIDMDEFVEGCLQLKGVAKNVEIANLHQRIKRIERRLSRFWGHLDEACEILRIVFAEQRATVDPHMPGAHADLDKVASPCRGPLTPVDP